MINDDLLSYFLHISKWNGKLNSISARDFINSHTEIVFREENFMTIYFDSMLLTLRFTIIAIIASIEKQLSTLQTTRQFLMYNCHMRSQITRDV